MLLEAVDLHVAYGGRAILDGVDIAVGSGESVAIVGPSGSGKTTLLSACGLLTEIDSGSVLFEGRPVRHLSQIGPGRVAWVFQSGNVLPRQTVLHNVMLGGLASGFSAQIAGQLARAALSAVGLADRDESQARELSGGELQRISIARALTSNPCVVIADEPTGNLDENTSQRVGKLLLQTVSPTTGVLIATHDLSLAERCDSVFVLTNGSLTRSR